MAKDRSCMRLMDAGLESEAQARAAQVGPLGDDWRAAGYATPIEAARVLVGADLRGPAAERAAWLVAREVLCDCCDERAAGPSGYCPLCIARSAGTRG